MSILIFQKNPKRRYRNLKHLNSPLKSRQLKPQLVTRLHSTVRPRVTHNQRYCGSRTTNKSPKMTIGR